VCRAWVVARCASGAGLGGAGVPRGEGGGGHRSLLGLQIDLPVLQTLSSLSDLEKLVDDENVEDGEGDNWANSQECFAYKNVNFEHVVFRYLEVFIRLPNTLCAIDESKRRV